MLDDNLPTYRFQPSSENPLSTILYFTHNGSEPSPDFLFRRPDPATSKNQYAIGLFDAQYPSVLYSEVLVRPEWTQPTLSAAEIRAQNSHAGGSGSNNPLDSSPLVPDNFSVTLYNPEQSVAFRHMQSSWSKTDSWEFEVPERSFKVPSASRIDQDGDGHGTGAAVSELTPKILFRWKREGRRDMTCYMSGRSVGGKKNKEPDITVALFRGGKSDSGVTIYEPNMARVDVEDRKGLEVLLLMSAEVIRELWIVNRPSAFNASKHAPGFGSSAGAPATGRKSPRRKSSASPNGAAAMSGTLHNAPPTTTMPSSSPMPPGLGAAAASSGLPRRHGTRTQGEIDAETRRLQAMVAEEERQVKERERREKQQRDQEEQERIKRMLEHEDKERRRRQAEVERETERLRQEYGVQSGGGRGTSNGASSPPLPQRPQGASQGQGHGHGQSQTQGHGRGWFSSPDTRPPQPPRPNSVIGNPSPAVLYPGGPPVMTGGAGPVPSGSAASYYQQQPSSSTSHPPSNSQSQQSGGKKKHNNPLSSLLNSPYAGPAAATVSGFFGGREEDKRKKVHRKRSVGF